MKGQPFQLRTQPTRSGVDLIKVVVSPPPVDKRVTRPVGTAVYPFEKVKHLLVDKPLRRIAHRKA